MTYTTTAEVPKYIANRWAFESSHLMGINMVNLRRARERVGTAHLSEQDTNIWVAALDSLQGSIYGYAVISYNTPIAWVLDTYEPSQGTIKRAFYLADIRHRRFSVCSRTMRAIEKHLTLVQHGQALTQTEINQATVTRVA
jgi:hypothetical protein